MAEFFLTLLRVAVRKAETSVVLGFVPSWALGSASDPAALAFKKACVHGVCVALQKAPLPLRCHFACSLA